MSKLDVAFQLTANADGMAAGVSKADRELSKVGASAKATSAEFRQAAKLTAELRTPTERYAESISRLDTYLQKGLVTQEVYGRAVAKADAELKQATSSLDGMAKSASIAERVINGTSGAIDGVASATKSVSEAGIAVIKFGKDIAYTYLQYRIFNAVKNPAGLANFAVGALKSAAAARTLILAAKALGIGLAFSGGATGTVAAGLVGLSNPLIGASLLAVNLGRAFLGARDRALEMAAAVTDGTKTIDSLNAELGTVQARQIDNLAFAMEEVSASASRSETAFATLSDAFVTPFVGAFAAIKSGFAGMANGFSSVIEGVASIVAPIGAALAPFGTLLGTAAEAALKVVGVLAQMLGAVLKVAGAIAHVLLSPMIVGFANFADTIRTAMNSAFEYITSFFDALDRRLTAFRQAMAKVPLIGGAFAGGETSSAPQDVAAAGAEQAAVAVQQNDQLDFELELYAARRQNEEAIAEARRKAASDQFDVELEQFAARRKMEQDIEEANRKAAAEQAKIDERGAEKLYEATQFKRDAEQTLSGKANEALKVGDVRSSEGIASYMALATGREDPAVEEYRKGSEKLSRILDELRAQNVSPAVILGGAEG